MSVTQLRNCNFGSTYANATGSTGVGYTIFDDDGIVTTPRTVVGVYQLMSGCGIYAAKVTFPNSFHGQIMWDTGTAFLTASYAAEQYNAEADAAAIETWHTKCDTSFAQDSMGRAQLLSKYASQFGPAIHIDSWFGIDGVVLGENGTACNPVQSVTAARPLANALNIRRYHLIGDLVLDQAHEDWHFCTSMPDGSRVNPAGFSIAYSTFTHTGLNGTMAETSGFDIIMQDCITDNITGLSGQLWRCTMHGSYAMASSAGLLLQTCVNLNGNSNPVRIFVDDNVNAGFFRAQGWTGLLHLYNVRHANSYAHVSAQGATVEIMPSCTAGRIWIEGAAKVINGAGSGCVVDLSALTAMSSSLDVMSGSILAISSSLANVSSSVGTTYNEVLHLSSSLSIMSGTITQISSSVGFIEAIEGGRWHIVGNQMVFYAANGMSEVARFDLFDSVGNPTMDAVFERKRS